MSYYQLSEEQLDNNSPAFLLIFYMRQKRNQFCIPAAIPADRRYIPAVLAEVMEAEAASSKYQKFGEQETKI